MCNNPHPMILGCGKTRQLGRRSNVLFQMQAHISDDRASRPLIGGDFFHGDLVVVAKPETHTQPRRIPESRPFGVIQFLSLSNEKLGRVFVGVVAADETRPVSLHKHSGGGGAVSPDRRQFADVRGGADVPSVLVSRVCVVLGVDGGHVEVGAVVADVAVDVGGKGAPAPVGDGVHLRVPDVSDPAPVRGGELVEDELAGSLVVCDGLWREVYAFVGRVAEDGGDFHVTVVFEGVVGVVLDEVVVQGRVPEVDRWILAARKRDVETSHSGLEAYSVKCGQTGDIFATCSLEQSVVLPLAFVDVAERWECGRLSGNSVEEVVVTSSVSCEL